MTQTHNNNVPKLRFPEFSGEWEIKKLQDVADFQNGKAHEQNISSGGDLVVVNSKFISTEGQVKKFTDTQISPLFVDDIVMVMSDIPKGRALAKCYLIEQDNRYSLNQRICKLKARSAVPYYLFLVTNRNDYFLKFDSGVTQTNLRKDEVLRCPAYYPTLPEQQKIAAFLSAIDSKIAQITKKKALLEQYKRGVMQKLFSGEMRFKDAQGKAFPEWVEKRLGEVVNIEMGQSPESHSYNENQMGVPLIQGNADILNRLSAPRRYTSEPTKLCNVGDLLLSVRAPIGEVSLSQHDACIGRGVAAIRSRKKSVVRFWFQFLLNYEPKWHRLGQGSTFSAISGTDIKNLKVLLPHPDEQQKIAAFLSAIDTKIDLIATELNHAKTFKKGLLQQMFI